MDGDLIEYSLSDNDFEKLSDMKFFEQMNDCLGLMIDDYEDEEILAPKLDGLKNFMHQFMHKHPNNPLLIKLDTLFQVAYSKRTGVFFFF